MEVEVLSDTKIEVLRVNIDKNWNSSDFVDLFQSLTFLYNIFVDLDKINLLDTQIYSKTPVSYVSKNIIDFNGELYKKLNFSDTLSNSESFKEKKDRNIFYLRQFKSDKVDLRVKQISYASPGFADLVGLGKIIENLTELIKYYIPNKNQKLSNQKLELDILEKKIQILKSVGYSEKEIKRIDDVKKNALSNLINLQILGKIEGIELKEIED